jgi:Lrp/AsnC family transcriptional regulator for asnA, asnC and gidA
LIVSTKRISAIQAKILKELLADGRESEDEIANKLGLTKQVVKNSILKMEKVGLIKGATTHINYRLFGYKAVAYFLIVVEPEQVDKLLDFLSKMPEAYSCFSRGVRGNVDVVFTLKTLEQLNEIKDIVKSKFSIIEMKTAIWTDVKEINCNLALVPFDKRTEFESKEKKCEVQGSSLIKNIVIDETDLKIADLLSVNGRMPIKEIGKRAGVSLETAKRKYEKLKENGALKVTIQINPVKVGYRALCVFFVVTSSEKSPSTIQKISSIPDVISIMKTSGDYDLMVYAMVQNIDQLLGIQEQIGQVSGVKACDMEMIKLDEAIPWPSPKQYISTF